jgi:hypothetical protein
MLQLARVIVEVALEGLQLVVSFLRSPGAIRAEKRVGVEVLRSPIAIGNQFTLMRRE